MRCEDGRPAETFELSHHLDEGDTVSLLVQRAASDHIRYLHLLKGLPAGIHKAIKNFC
jgi:hypothetical protein